MTINDKNEIIMQMLLLFLKWWSCKKEIADSNSSQRTGFVLISLKNNVKKSI